jgi:glutathione S-transferase
MKLHRGIASVSSVKVRFGLAEMGLDYQEQVLGLQKGD